MTFLPIVSRELRLASRRRSTYWLRSGAALTVMVVGTWLFLLLRGEGPKQLAWVLFCVLTGGAVLLAIGSGPRFTSDCLSEEKREGTLGLLFLTDLKGYDVVLGKLAASSFNAFYSIMAVVPMMAIPLLLGGGITLAEFGRISLVLVDALFFSLTLAICVSSMSLSAHRAAAISALLILFFAAFLPFCAGLIAAATHAQRVVFLLLSPSVGFSYYLAFDAAYTQHKTWFWLSLGGVHAVSWLFLVLASVIAPRSWQERSRSQFWARSRERWIAWAYGDSASRTAFRRRLHEASPVYWLSSRIRSKPPLVWLFLGILAMAWAWCWWRMRREWLNEGVYLGTAFLLNLALRFWFASEAALLLAEGRKTGALELLLSTPLQVEEILHGQWLALRRQFLGPVLAVLAIECLFMLATVRQTLPDDDRRFWCGLWTAGMTLFVADLVALYWIGMWSGLTARNALRAAGSGLARVLVAPWVAYGLVILLMVLLQFGPQTYQPNPSWRFFLGLWLGLGLGLDFAFAAWARQKLLTEFRWAARATVQSRE